MAQVLDRDLRRFSRRAVFLRFVGRLLCRAVHTFDGPVDTFGRPVVVVANHRSFFDVPVGFALLESISLRARILVRAKYFDIPLVGRFLRSAGCISAGSGWRATINTAVETLEAGRPVAVMLEGRIVPPEKRNESGLGKVRRGFLEIARAADAVVLPVAMVGSDEVWPIGRRLPRLPWHGRPLVQIHVGETVVIDDLTNREALEAVRSVIASHITRMSQEAPQTGNRFPGANS
ncbi:MAG: lysophospholipid acyltransferase family protein [Acidimicrobiaceae bacterium]|nr:lysophospholipid acyltransferase family protein [Acidimicrobiaceae bacterium]